MERGTLARLGLLTSLYFSQGLPYGFFSQALPVLLRNQGLSLPAIGAASLLALPWMLKFLWAPLVDRTPAGALGVGRRKAWILPLQALATLILAGLAFVDAGAALPIVMAGTLLTNAVAATQDVAADGLAVELLRPDERGFGNAIQVGGYRVGMIVGGGALLAGYAILGWKYSFLVMAGLLALATVPIVLHREAPPPGEVIQTSTALTDLWAAIKRPGMAEWLVLLGIYKMGEALGTGMVRPFLVDSGLGMSEIGTLLGLGGFTAGLAGALLGGWGVGLLGRRRAVGAFGVVQSVAVAAWALPALGLRNPAAWWGCSLLETLCSGLATVAVFTVMMDACRREEGQSGTDYTIQACAFVLATGLASSVSGVVAASLGYAAHFVLAGLFSLGGAVLLATRMEPVLGRLGSI